MRIEELVLEGFKSYPVRTTITGWDSSFNAITGLNGSGKSNILDAICFVLGLTDMSKLRCQNQQDLIYKRGAAGITKASVTIVFNNEDRSKSPAGFEESKQITVTRQIALPNISKYLLNGHKAQQQAIHSLFQSVQLNINNPNFLIQQGRITKVLNMRPQEILGLVEEAAGTRMFEDRKEKAIKTMAKKEKKVDEITSLLNEEIIPKLDGLRTEKRAYLLYQKTVTELDRLTRLIKAHQWYQQQEQLEAKQDAIAEQKGVLAQQKSNKKQKEREIKEAEKQKESVEKRRDKEIEKGGKLKELEGLVEAGEKELARYAAQLEIKQGSIEEDQKRSEQLEASLQELMTAIGIKEKQLGEALSEYNTVKEAQTAAQERLASQEELLQTLMTGLANSQETTNTTGGGYLGQIADAKKRMAMAASEEQSHQIKLEMSVKDLKEKEAKRKQLEKEGGEGRKTLDAGKQELEKLRRQVEGTGWNAEKEQEARNEMAQAEVDVGRLGDELAALHHNISNIDFSYSDPSPNFDRAKVKGLVAKLITLDEQHFDKTQALEICAGGKLYNVVVDDEKVASQLLNNGKLKRRVTIIPLTKIQGNPPPPAKLAKAQRLAPGRIDSAISLVGYDEEVSAAMAYVFGSTLICADNQAASLAAFDKEVGLYSVSLDGTAYDPSGTLSGGAPPTGSGVLVKIAGIKKLERELNEARAVLAGHKQNANRETWKRLSRELDLKAHEVKLLEEQIGGSSAGMIAAEIESLKSTIEILQQAVKDAKTKQQEAVAEANKLEKDMEDFKNNKDSKLKELKADISKQKTVVSKHGFNVKQKQKDHQTAQLELEQLQNDLEKARKEVDGAKASRKRLKKDLQECQAEMAGFKEEHEQNLGKLKKERATLTRYDEELAALEEAIKGTRKEIVDVDVAIENADHALKTTEGQISGLVTALQKLEQRYEWIEEDKKLFGKPGTIYNFNDEGVDMKKMYDKARELEELQKGQSKKINPKVVNMLDSVEKKETALKKMLSTVLKDKTKIEKTIEELERHKRDALEKCWTKVNGDFGEIFAELLPGNFAKLVPTDGRDVTQGLDVKVRLGQVWKESLTELSGGQRSLIALSLIMSLLQVKPAPMYILDEIDSALDLSHTQHIGQLFRSRFKGSQFIVVSLKEGLFTNANVLFRARFRDGTSVVERTAQRSASSMYEGNRDNESDNQRRSRR